MIRALYSAASGMTAQEMNVDNIANNLANSNTAGYKSRRAQFQDLMYQNVIQPGAAAGQQSVVPTGLQLGLGTRTSSNEIIFTQGDFSQTNNPLDVVIQGNGFFQVLQPNGSLAYTRAGTFQLNNTGNVVDSNGNLLQPSITIPANAQSVTIATDGTVSYTFRIRLLRRPRGRFSSRILRIPPA
jgi:flagellar basal-body rod protein FlgG